MKKRLLSIALVLVLALSLLPFGAAAARVNGPDAFALVKDYAVQNGAYSGDSYVYQCAEEKVDDMPGTFYLKYTPASDVVTLRCTFSKNVITFETTLVIPASLEMPYTARMNVTGLLTASQTAAVDSGFNTTTPLTITEQSTSMQVDSLEESFRYMLALMPFIFDKFYRGKNCGSEQGSGLGLYIVKYITEKMGGSILLRNHISGLEAVVALPVEK